jgi:uncharacterized protein (DUF1697 family)
VTFVGLLRAVNVGGKNLVAMAELRATMNELGFKNVTTLLQSGNVVFGAPAQNAAKLEGRLEAMLLKSIGVTTTFIVRSAPEWNEIVAGNPFADAGRDDPGHLIAMPLRDAPARAAVAALVAAISGREQVQVIGRTLYAVYPDGIGRSRLTIALIERHLNTRGTARNWNTVLKLSAAAGY